MHSRFRIIPSGILFCLALFSVSLLLLSCTQVRGLGDGRYSSSTRPALRVAVPALTAQGTEHRIIKLPNMGVLGGLNLDTWITVFGTSEGPMAVSGHADLPAGWEWDANMSHPFAVNEEWVNLGGVPFFAQTTLEDERHNPFVEAQAEKTEHPAFWLVRSFQARFNNYHTKLILEYRERAPMELTNLAHIPFGQSNLLSDFAKRAEQAFSIDSRVNTQAETLSRIPGLHTRYLDAHFFGSASPIDNWRLP